MGKEFCAIRETWFLLLSQDCHQAHAQVRLPHRHRRTHREPLQVQQDYEVTIPTLKLRETEAILHIKKTQRKVTIKQRAVNCEISRSGFGEIHRQSRRHRSASTRIHPSRFKFRTSHESGNQEAQYLHSLPERPELRNTHGNQDYEGSLQKTHWRSRTSG